MSNEQIVNDALDQYVVAMRARGGLDPEGVRAETLARIAGMPRDDFSHLLQQYRLRQRQHHTRYVIAAEGYGRAGRWHILAKPGADALAVREARRQAALWSARDARDRFVRDVIAEIRPGLKGTALDNLIVAAADLVSAQMDATVVFVEQQLATFPA